MATGEAKSSDYDEANAPKEKTAFGWHKYWTAEIDAATERTQNFRKQGNGVIDRYKDERSFGAKDPFEQNSYNVCKLNIFHKNISTVQSMLYGSTPKIEVSREHQDPDDDVARVASMMYQRILEADIRASGEKLPTVLRASLQDRLLPGLGMARVRYEMGTRKSQVISMETGEPTEEDVLAWEDAVIEYVHWTDFLWGWARTWSEIPWIAYRAYMDKDEVTERFGSEIAGQLEYTQQDPSGEPKETSSAQKDEKSTVWKAQVWEIWQISSRKVFWLGRGSDRILDKVDDPLELDGFWPSPMPMLANCTTNMLMPVADFVVAQDLYNEIDILQSRIHHITKAIRVVGVYDKSSEGVKRMLKEGSENELIPVDNWAMFSEKNGLQGVVDWFPVADVVSTLNVLIEVRNETINLLYQVTGLSDILRGGNTDQYTSDGTQKLKAKFGSITVQALQDEFARFASELDELKAEVVSKHFSPESIYEQSGADFLPMPDKQLIPQALQLMQSQKVKWRVDIRPESIAMVDYAQLKSERTEFLTAMATYIQSAQAAVQQVPNSLPVLLEMLKWGMAGFKGSNYLEGIMDQAIEGAKNAPPQNKQEEQQQQQADMAKIQAKLQADMQTIQAKSQAEIAKITSGHQAKMEQQLAKDRGDMQKIMADLKADMRIIAAKLNADLQTERSQATNAAAELQVGHENTLIEMQSEHENTMSEIEANDTNDDNAE
jgi:hypothetical protein